MPAPHITRSQSKPPTSSLGRGLDLSTSMLTAPSDVPSAPGASLTFGADSIDTGVPHSTDATKRKYGGVTRRTVGRWTIGADEV
jgi:hypothetical protein